MGMDTGELSWRERGRLWLRLGLRCGLTLAAAVLLVLAGPGLLSLFFPFVLALLLAWLLNPALRALQKRVGGSRGVWAMVLLALLFLLVGGLLATLSYNIFVELRALVENWQSIWAGFLAVLDRLGGWGDRFSDYLPAEVVAWGRALLDRLVSWVQSAVPGLLSTAAAGAGAAAMKVPPFLVAFLVFVMASYFIMADYPHIRYLALERMNADTLGLLRFIKHTAAAAFGGYVRAQFILSVGVFFILLAGFTLTGREYALLLALLLAVLDFIPIVGAGTVMVPWAVVCLFARDLRTALELLVIWGIIALFRRVGEPKVVGNQTGLSPILSLGSIYVGMKLAGVAGMILGPVVFLVVLNICRAGVFDGLTADVRLAVRDIRAILGNRPREGK